MHSYSSTTQKGQGMTSRLRLRPHHQSSDHQSSVISECHFTHQQTSDCNCKNALQTHKPLYGCYSGMGPEWGHDHGLLIFSSQLGLKRTQRLQRVRVQARLSQRIDSSRLRWRVGTSALEQRATADRAQFSTLRGCMAWLSALMEPACVQHDAEHFI